MRLRPVIGPPPAVVNPCAMSPAATASQVRPPAWTRDQGIEVVAHGLHQPRGGTPARCSGLAVAVGGCGGVAGEAAQVEARALGHGAGLAGQPLPRRAGDRANAAGDGKPTLRSGCGRQATAEDGSDTVACTAREGYHTHALKC